MKPGTEAGYVSEFKQFNSATLASLESQPSGSFVGFTKDGNVSWIVRGSLLEVVSVSTGARLAAWQFGLVIGDNHTSVTCVKEFQVGKTLKLLVGVCNASSNGLLCIFDVSLSKVTKAIEIPRPVTEVEVVSTYTGDLVPRWALSEHLRYFSGLVAVGTNTGHVLLIDMCTDDMEFFSDEEVPSKLKFITPRVRDIENQRFHCMSQGLCLALELNSSLFTSGGFEYQKPDGLVMKTFRIEDVSITCLHYIQQAGLLVLGYSFGCFQLWKLHVPVLEYSSRLEADPVPITHIAYQEPENDPKNFCYIWVARGQSGTQDDERSLDAVSSISLYQLAFSNKCFYSNYGVFYDGLASVCLRMDHDLASTLVQTGSNYEGGSRVIACNTLTDPRYKPPSKLSQDESFEESSRGQDLSLCVFVWEATEVGSSRLGHHLAIFDINRWYHAQMPSTVRYVSGLQETCSYLSWRRLDKAVNQAGNDDLLGAHVQCESLRKFDNSSPMPPEQHFYPAALAFDVDLVFETGSCHCRFLGAQRQILASLESQGPQALLQPGTMFNLCVQTGLLPRPSDITTVVPGLVSQRESLLGLALEYNMVTYLKSCITQWSGGEFEHQGCGLKFLLDWTWETVSRLKHSIDSICAPLFNWSGLNLDTRAIQTLHQCGQKLTHLIYMLQTLVSCPVTVEGEAELHNKVLVASLLSRHLSVVLWFVSVGLLPENDDTEVSLGGQYCYPVTSLMTAYKQRRTELASIHSDIGETDLLMIDGLVESLGVFDLWDREGGTGLYPPPSLHALLSSYLLDKGDVLSMSCLVLYLLLDLISVDSDLETNNFSMTVSGFARRFNIPLTLVKLVQAFWLLDHQDFQEALSLLLDPMVRVEFSRWQHGRIIKSLLYQGDAKMALRYLTTVRPSLSTPEEVKLKLTVLLANGLTEKALSYQRRCRDKTNMHDLLTHLFLGCQQTKTVDRLLQLHLSPEEETYLVQYLTESSEPRSQELLLMHYLQRARFVEAVQLNEKLKHSALHEGSSRARDRASARSAIVEKYASLLPGVQRKLLFENVHVSKKNTHWRREVRRPTPLSMKITQSCSKVTSQSTYIMAIMETLDEVETQDKQEENLDQSCGAFICTPVTPARASVRNTPVTCFPEEEVDINTSVGCGLNKSLSLCYSPHPVGTPNKTDRRSRIFSAACLTLLQTPTVKKMTPRKPVRASNSGVVTPQSILKVRHLISATSPSPHSANTTPNSQELESSGRKMSRRLGYGTTTPLSSIPRHLASGLTSQAASPKSVSFLEPSDEVSTPQHSKPSTPKSVSFADKSLVTSTRLESPLSTPKQLRFAEMDEPRSEQKLSLRLHGQASTSSQKSLRDRSPTPESPERSPRLASKLDELHRKPLHAPLPTPVTTETTQQQQEEEDLKLRLEEDSESNISDEDVEEMEGSFASAASPMSDDMSFASVATVREKIPSPTAFNSPQSLEKSPVPGSPKIKVSKSPVSEFVADDRKYSSSEHAQLPTSSTEHVQTGSALLATEGSSRIAGEPVSIDLTDDDNMEVEEGHIVTDSVETRNKEIFNDFEEINPQGEVENEEQQDLIEEEESNKGMDVVTETAHVTSQQEVTSSSEVLVQQDVISNNETTSTTPITTTETEEAIISPQLRRRPLHPSLESPPSSPNSARSSSRSPGVPTGHDVSAVLREIDERFPDSPPVTDEVKPLRGKAAGREDRRSRARPKFDIPDVKPEDLIDRPSTSVSIDKTLTQETPEEVSVRPGRSPQGRPRRQHASPSSSPVGKASPSTTSKKHTSPVKSKSSPVKSESQENAEIAQSEISNQTDNALTPTRASRRLTKMKQVQEKLEEISATSPLKFSQAAKEQVQDALLQISEELKADKDFNSNEEEMTRIKERSSPPKTPPRSSRKKKVAGTPTRSSKRQTEKSEGQATDSGVDTNDENVPVTPTRSRRTRQSVSPSGETQVTKATTPRRGRKKAQSPDKNNSNIRDLDASSYVVDSETIPESAQVKKTPTRGRKKKMDINTTEIKSTEQTSSSPLRSLGFEDENVESKRDSFGASVIPEDVEMVDEETEVPTTPSRRHSLRRACKTPSTPEPAARTPTRRHSAGRGKKTEELSPIPEQQQSRTPTRRSSLGRTTKADIVSEPQPKTPTRRQSLGRNMKFGESEENIEKVKTPTRRQSIGRGKKQTADVDSNLDLNTDKEKENQLTPSRRGRAEKSEVLETVVDTEVEPVITPSRRGRSKKSETSPVRNKAQVEQVVTPSRRGRPKKTDTSPVKSESDSLEPVVTPSRKGRAKKSDIVSSESTTEKLTPSRRGRPKKDAKVKLEEENHSSEDIVERLAASPSKRAKKSDKLSPQRRTRSHDADVLADTSVTALPDVFDVEQSSFQFSAPMAVEASDDVELPKPFTSTKSFLFSPPISHAKSVLSRQQGAEPASILLPPPVTELVKEEEGGAKSKPKSRKVKRLYKEREDVLLISPPVWSGSGDEVEEGRDTITRTTRSTRAAAGARKATTTKQDGAKLMVQSVGTRRQRGSRTSYRFGAVSKKKSES